MANFAFNIGKGRGVELYRRVKANDPANSALILIPLSSSGTEAQGQDLDDMAAIEADANFAEQTGGGWVRKTLTDAQLAAFPAPDDTNNWYAVQVPAVTWTGPTAGSNATGLILAYDPDTTGGTDADLIPIGHYTFTVTADGNDVALNVGDFLRAS
jgi:hypothetical protein